MTMRPDAGDVKPSDQSPRVAAPTGDTLKRIGGLLGLTLGGFALGLVGDVWAGGGEIRLTDIPAAFALAPILATIGGGSVDAPAREFFMVSGCLFLPVQGFLAWRWVWGRRTPWLAVGILVWTTLGLFQPIHRLWVIMSA